MNFGELIVIIGFVETIILFLYALRWYIFTLVTLRPNPSENTYKLKCNPNSCFVSVLLPIYNEPNVVNRLLKACTSFNFPSYEVVVIDDSNDGVTTDKLEKWRGYSMVKIIHRNSREGWKGGALNVALEEIDPRSTHVLIFDADFVPSSDLVSRFVSRFTDGRSAVQGYQKHDLNADHNWVTKGVRVWTSLYNMVELNGQQRMGLFSPFTGCVFMAHTDLLLKLKFEGVTDEDWNLTMRLYENGNKIFFDPNLAASGECPSNLKHFLKQQARWAEGHTRTFRKHFIKIWKSNHLNLKEKIDFVFIGASFLNVTLILLLTLAWIVILFFPTASLPVAIIQANSLLFLATIPAGVFAPIVALYLEGAKKDWKKLGYGWLLNFIASPIVAYAALKGLITKNGYFHRTYKTGKITRTKVCVD